MKELLQMIYDTVMQHMPDSAAWVPYAGTALLGLFGLLLLVKGAKLAPWMAALTFLALGGLGGSFVSYWIGTPPWVTMIACGVIGFALGLVLFKYWLAILVAGCCICAALSFYGVRIVWPHMADYSSSNFGQEVPGEVVMPKAGADVLAKQSTEAELAQEWAFLCKDVPNFQTSVWAIVISTGLAGLAFSLLLPGAAKALFAATAGTFCVFVAIGALLKVMWPSALTWLASTGTWGWAILGVVWVIALLHNLLDVRRKRPKSPKVDKAPSAKRTAHATA
jgi:hypothetical protein